MKDYDLVSTADKGGPAHGMVSPKWYQTRTDRAELKKLIQRENAPALRDALYYYGLMAGFAICAVALTPSLACLPFWLAYGFFTRLVQMRAGMNVATVRPLKRHG